MLLELIFTVILQNIPHGRTHKIPSPWAPVGAKNKIKENWPRNNYFHSNGKEFSYLLEMEQLIIWFCYVFFFNPLLDGNQINRVFLILGFFITPQCHIHMNRLWHMFIAYLFLFSQTEFTKNKILQIFLYRGQCGRLSPPGPSLIQPGYQTSGNWHHDKLLISNRLSVDWGSHGE